MKTILQLFWEFFRLSLCVVGGGYAIIAVADSHFARKRWTKEGELLDMLPVFQMVPGLIATHTAVYLGRKLAGIAGAAVSVVAIALPAVGVFLALACGYDSLPLGHPLVVGAFTGLRAVLSGIIAAAIARSWRRSLDSPFSYALFALTFGALALLGANAALVLVCAMLFGLIREWLPLGKGRCFRSSALLPLLLFVKFGLLAFGGGFVIVPMYAESFVGASAPYLQIASEEFSNVMALSQMTPGPVGVNCATFFGYRLAGIGGALFASAMLLLPGSALAYLALSSLERFRSSRVVRGILAGVRPASVALMLAALVIFVRSSCACVAGAVLTVVAFAAIWSRRVGVMSAIVASVPIGIALALLGLAGCASSVPRAPVKLVAHRGAADLTMPEASLPAYSNAVEQAADIVKLDLQQTKDGVIVMGHDPGLWRVMRWGVSVSNETYAAILEKGRFVDRWNRPTDLKIVRLDEALAVVREVPEFWIDFKNFDEDFAERVLCEFRRARIDFSRIMVATFSRPALAYFQRRHPEIRRVGHISGRRTAENVLKYCEKFGLWGVNLPVQRSETSKDAIRELKRRGIWVSLWFVQNRETAEIYRDAGMDAFVTDHMSLVRPALDFSQPQS